MLDQQRKDRGKLVLGELVAESVQVLDRVDGEDGVDGSRRGLEVGENILSKEINNVDENVDGGDAALDSRSTRGDGSEKVDGSVLAFPVLLGVLLVLLTR